MHLGRVPTADDQLRDGSADLPGIVNFAKAVSMEQGAEIENIFDAAIRRARDLIFEHSRAIQKVARALVKRGELNEHDLDALLGPMTTSNEADKETLARWVEMGVVRWSETEAA